MKRRRKTIGLVLLFLVGLSILLYPTVSNKWNEYRARRLISTYDYAVGSGDSQDYAEMLEAARLYNENLLREVVPDAFSVRDGQKDNQYENLLNPIGDGTMGYVEIPAIDVSIPIYHYTTEEVLQEGVGHLFGSSLPVGGESTHAVLSAHRGLPNAKLFTDLNLVEEGDLFFVHVLGEVLAYQVDQYLEVEPSDTESLAISQGDDYVTLVTCTPYAVNTHRILVRGHRVPYDDTTYSESQSTASTKKQSVIPQLICVLIGIAIAAVLVMLFNRKTLKRRSKRK